VVTIGTTGDIHPLIRIAKTLQALGRKVTFITNTYHAKLLQGSGLAFVGLGTDDEYLRVVRNPNVWDVKKGFSALLVNYKDQLEQIEAAIQSIAGPEPMVAIAHPLAVPGTAICRERGLITSIVSMHLAPSTLQTCHDPLRIGSTAVPRWVPMSWRRALWRFVEKVWIDPFGISQINAAREPLKLPKVSSSFLAHIASAPDLTVTLFPYWFGPVMPDWPKPLLTGGFQLFEADSQASLSHELSTFLANGDRPLVFTPGTGHLHAAAFFSSALSVVSVLGRRAIFLTKERAQVPANLPATVLWQPYAPLLDLLPRTAALVHHGGIGTTAEALRAGTPQLVVPFAWDQFDNGARVASLGAGLVIPATRLSPGRLTRGIHTLTASESIRSRCVELSKNFIPHHDPTALCAEIDRSVSNSCAA
jgi:rhamnosyltransferase subunit B